MMDDQSIDAVTADHCHASSVWRQCALGSMFIARSLAHSVHEARDKETFAKSGVATQMGTQIHANDNYRRVVELVQSELLQQACMV